MTRPPSPVTLVRSARLVPVGGGAAADGTVDLLLRDGVVAGVGAGLRATPPGASAADEVVEADGRWVVPGLWDQHVHLTTWARTRSMVDLSGTASPAEAVRRVADHLAARGAGGRLVSGFGYRSGAWDEVATVAALDAVAGDVPVVLSSGDAHNGWLSSAALRLLGHPPVDGPLEENAWFALQPAISALLEQDERSGSGVTALRGALTDAAARGVVGLVDLEMPHSWRQWRDRVAGGDGVADLVRVRASVYPEDLDAALAAGVRSGDRLVEDAEFATMGPFKVISDGSLNTRTAWCCEPYPAAGGGTTRGRQNYDLDELVDLLSRADGGGLEIALHAIGDGAVDVALRAFERTGARGGVEHAQLVRLEDLPRMGRLGVRASVQPAHLLDDRDTTARLWGDRADRCFALRSMLDAGVVLALGSDAPVAPLDPWLAMAAAVHRSADDRAPWNPAESLTSAEALAASTDGRGTVAVGGPADLVLLDDDPLAPSDDPAEVAARLRDVRVAATLVAGRVTHRAL